MLKLEIDEKFEELSNLYDLFENITRIDYVPLEYREEIKRLLIKAYKDGNQEFEKIYEKLKRLEQLEKENQELKIEIQDLKDNETIVANYGVDLWNENHKLKKAIEIFKRFYQLEESGLHIGNMGFYGIFRKLTVDDPHNITKQDYILLKEVLENEMV